MNCREINLSPDGRRRVVADSGATTTPDWLNEASTVAIQSRFALSSADYGTRAARGSTPDPP